MKMQRNDFIFAQIHLKLYNIVNKFWNSFPGSAFSNKLEHVSILVRDFHSVGQLLTATRAEIYFHSKFTTVAYCWA